MPFHRIPWQGIGLRQHRTIPALRLKHRSGSCGTASALPKCSIMSGCGTRIVLRGQKPLALCDRCPCFGSLFPPLAALTFAASSIICAFGLASAAPRSPYRHLELCGIALTASNILSPIQYNKIRHPDFCGQGAGFFMPYLRFGQFSWCALKNRAPLPRLLVKIAPTISIPSPMPRQAPWMACSTGEPEKSKWFMTR